MISRKKIISFTLLSTLIIGTIPIISNKTVKANLLDKPVQEIQGSASYSSEGSVPKTMYYQDNEGYEGVLTLDRTYVSEGSAPETVTYHGPSFEFTLKDTCVWRPPYMNFVSQSMSCSSTTTLYHNGYTFTGTLSWDKHKGNFYTKYASPDMDSERGKDSYVDEPWIGGSNCVVGRSYHTATHYYQGHYYGSYTTNDTRKYKGVYKGTLHKNVPHPQGSTTPSYNGSIDITPISSSKITGNRLGWVNKNIDVNISIQGDKVAYTSNKKSREYITGYYSYSGNPIKEEYKTGSSYIDCSYTQKWKVKGIQVTGSGINTFISGSSGTITLSNEMQKNTLSAYVVWEKDGDPYWNDDAVSDIRFHHWQTKAQLPPTAETPEPRNYSTNTKEYSIDKTMPTYSLNTNGYSLNQWTNKDILVRATLDDNLSGIYNNINESYLSLIKSDYLENKEDSKISVANGIYDININKDGIYSINGKITDIAKNYTNISSSTYKLDKTKPSGIINIKSRTNLNEIIDFNVDVQDNLSGITKVEYLVSKDKDNPKGNKIDTKLTTKENSNEKKSFNVKISENGEWYLHVWITDKAGNVNYIKSDVAKYLEIDIDDIKISPNSDTNIVLRGTRFDIITKIDNIKDFKTKYQLHYIVPKWVDDNVNYKKNNEYSCSQGTVDKISKQLPNDTTSLTSFYHGFLTPFGVPLTNNYDGNKIGNEYEIIVYLTIDDDGSKNPTSTSPIKKSFKVAPEQKIQTNIIYNE